jgi:hypothetical protein
VFTAIYVAGILFLVLMTRISMPTRLIAEPENTWLQQSHGIALAMFQYATDHDGNYPDGKSSTEAFQKLLDGGYVNDPGVFYVPLPGKRKAERGEKLKAENVCWDVTGGVSSNDPDEVPMVFMTGFKVHYAPGGAAVPVIKPYPSFGERPTWFERWGLPAHSSDWMDFPKRLVVSYKSMSAAGIKLDETAGYSAPNFIPAKAPAFTKTYRQLTPDGTLP